MLSELVPPEHLAARNRNSVRLSGMLHLRSCKAQGCGQSLEKPRGDQHLGRLPEATIQISGSIVILAVRLPDETPDGDGDVFKTSSLRRIHRLFGVKFRNNDNPPGAIRFGAGVPGEAIAIRGALEFGLATFGGSTEEEWNDREEASSRNTSSHSILPSIRSFVTEARIRTGMF